tara:strand:- start:431 stop:1393 length:963 start_codon:yes stop_codon:yes gene_type:complete
MRRLSYPEFLKRREEFDAAVAGTAEISKFCSSSAWQVAANGFLHESESESEPEFFIVEEEGNWVVLVEREQPGIWFPMESAWMFGSPLIGDLEACVSLLRCAVEELKGPVGFCIGGVRKEGELHGHLKELGRKALRYEEFPATDCMRIDLAEGYDAWLARRSKKFQKSVRQLGDNDGCEIVDASLESPDLVFRRILEVQRRTYKWRDGTDIFRNESYVRFYRYLIEQLSESGRLRVLMAQREGADVAYILGGDFAGGYRGLQMSYVETERSTGIGNRLQLENLKQCAKAGLADYDLGMHADYKERWADRQDEYVAVFVVM